MVDVAAASEQRRRRVDLSHVWQSLLRLPFVLGRLALELLPVVAFVGTATLLLSTAIGDLAITRRAILAIVNAYAICRGLVCVARALVCPPGLLTVRAETAAYIEIWVRRIVTVGVAGIAIANVALLLGLHRGGHAALVRLVMLVVHLLVVVVILQCRRPVAEAIRSAQRQPSGRRVGGARPNSRPVAHPCDRGGDGAVGRVGAECPQRLYAAAAILCRHHRGCLDYAAVVHRGARPDRPRFPHQPGSPAAVSRPRRARQPLRPAAAPGRGRRHRRDRASRAPGSVGRRCGGLVLWRPDRQPAAVGGGHRRHRGAGSGGDLGDQQRATGPPARRR